MIYINEQTAINFRHSVNVSGSRMTVCELVGVEGKEYKILSYAQAYCHPKDNFNKEFGRRTALKRCVETLPKSDRKIVWEAYLNR